MAPIHGFTAMNCSPSPASLTSNIPSMSVSGFSLGSATLLSASPVALLNLPTLLTSESSKSVGCASGARPCSTEVAPGYEVSVDS